MSVNTKTDNRARWTLIAFQIGLFFSLIGINPGGNVGGGGNFLRQFGWTSLAALAVIGVYSSRSYVSLFIGVLRAMRVEICVLGSFWLLALASSSWAEEPSIVFKRALLLGVVLFICILVAGAAQLRAVDASTLMVSPAVLLLALSIPFSAAFPGVAFTDIGWQGILGQKNEMGQLAALTLFALLFGSHPMLENRPKYLLGCIVACAALVLSKSSTAMIGFTVSVGCVFVLRFFLRSKHRFGMGVIFYFLIAFILVLLHFLYVFDSLPDWQGLQASIFEFFGKSPDFTGRTKLWDLVVGQSIYRSEIIGGGYGGFWDINFQRVAYINLKLGFGPIQAHNGYLDVFNDLGYVGLALLGCILVYYVQLVCRRCVMDETRHFHVAFAVYFLLVNFSESSIFRTTQSLNMMFMLSFLLIGLKGRPVNKADPSASSMQVHAY